MRENSLEWLHCVLLETKRLGRRYLIEDSPFVFSFPHRLDAPETLRENKPTLMGKLRSKKKMQVTKNIGRVAGVIQADVKHFGVSKTAYDMLYRAVNRLGSCRILRCMTIETADPSFLEVNSNYDCRFLESDELHELAKSNENDLSEAFLQGALSKGDQCLAILDGDRLASYGWYSNRPTEITDDLNFCFDRRYIYMYKGFTHPGYRGQRLHAIGMTRALAYYLDHGFKGLVSWVEDNNFGSLKSVHRMGYKDFGKIYVLGCFGKYLIHCSPGCKELQTTVARRDA